MNEKQKHSPAPWAVKWKTLPHSDIKCAADIRDANGYSLFDLRVYGDARAELEFEYLEDARLIAAAPDLLAALKVMAAAVEGLYPEHRGAYDRIGHEVMAKAVFAINRAEGGGEQ